MSGEGMLDVMDGELPQGDMPNTNGEGMSLEEILAYLDAANNDGGGSR